MISPDICKQALDLAIQVAVAAGQRLRSEFLQPGGPRGGGSHADVDHEVEVEIRRALLEPFPDWSYLGEETGRENKHGPARWVVDPNDGTSSYLQGVRGSAVSIGLLWEGTPVLGVVYSPLYPDNEGDLLAWGEGCGPLRRNGVPIPPPAWPTALTPQDVVIVSQSGDSASEANLQCVSPARFRCMASIAYRLALVAAGEAVAGVSLSGPEAHDFAACHALLSGQGGVLLNQAGQPVVYDQHGYASTRYCFGGAPAICQALARRPWHEITASRPPTTAGMAFPVPEKKGKAVGQSGLLSRALGCWLGQLCGDSLGSLVEFRSRQSIAQDYPDGPRCLSDGGTYGTLAGQPTDDSELALCLARTLIARHGYDRTATYAAYRSWLQSDPFDVGTTTWAGLSGEHPPESQRPSTSQANGSLMRCSPLALAGWSDLNKVMDWSDQDASLTHPHPVCLQANRAYLRAMVAGLNGADPGQMYEAARTGADAAIVETLEAARHQPPADFSHHMGWVLIALQNALYQLLHASSLEEGVVETVRAGGDTDTNGCIAAALLGAAYGIRAIPAAWRLAVLSCRPHLSFEACRQPRPIFCWPVDAYQVAERLVTL